MGRVTVDTKAAKTALSIRISPALKAALEESSASTGRSITQEVEIRLERSFAEDQSEGDRAAGILTRVLVDRIKRASGYFDAVHGEAGIEAAGATLARKILVTRIVEEFFRGADCDLDALTEAERTSLAQMLDTADDAVDLSVMRGRFAPSNGSPGGLENRLAPYMKGGSGETSVK